MNLAYQDLQQMMPLSKQQAPKKKKVLCCASGTQDLSPVESSIEDGTSDEP
jgi:hypothetical protein